MIDYSNKNFGVIAIYIVSIILIIILMIWYSIALGLDGISLNSQYKSKYPKLNEGAKWTIRVCGWIFIISEIIKGSQYIISNIETINQLKK
jgi:uncharacterized membrane protein YecN with MAPEG domain